MEALPWVGRAGTGNNGATWSPRRAQQAGCFEGALAPLFCSLLPLCFLSSSPFLDQCFPDCAVHENRLGILLKCRRALARQG